MRKIYIWVILFGCGLLSGCAALKDRLPPPELDDRGVRIQYEDPSAWRVELAGQFNDWKIFPDQKSIQMTKDENGVWSVNIPFREYSKDNRVYVEHGKRYQYKIVVNGTSWIEDPNNPLKGTEGGISNSLLVIPEKRASGR